MLRTTMSMRRLGVLSRQLVQNPTSAAIATSSPRRFASTSDGAQQELDPKELKKLVLRCVEDLSGATAVQMMYIGDNLGLFKRIAAAGAEGMTATTLANESRCHPRYIEQWCDSCVANSFLEWDSEKRRYFMTIAQQEVLANEGGMYFQCGTAQVLSAGGRATPAIIERGFKNLQGGGVKWSELGTEVITGMARMSSSTHRNLLPGWVSSVPEASEALSRPHPKVLDIGCGCGESTLSLAAEFPQAEFLGIDPDPESIQRANQARDKTGASNVTFQCTGVETLVAPQGFDLALAYDCIHDMAHPTESLSRVRSLLVPGSTSVFLWFEPHGSDDPVKNRDILGARLVAGLALNCVTTSMANGGVGLGAHGCTPKRAEGMATSAGFGKFRVEGKLEGARFRNNVYVLQ